MRLMSQSRARTCDFLTRTIFFIRNCMRFFARFSGNVYASGTVCGSSFPLPLPLPPSKQIIDYFVNAQQQLKRGGVGGGEIIRIKFRKKPKVVECATHCGQ